jgi:hypothetical protein
MVPADFPGSPIPKPVIEPAGVVTAHSASLLTITKIY